VRSIPRRVHATCTKRNFHLIQSCNLHPSGRDHRATGSDPQVNLTQASAGTHRPDGFPEQRRHRCSKLGPDKSISGDDHSQFFRRGLQSTAVRQLPTWRWYSRLWFQSSARIRPILLFQPCISRVRDALSAFRSEHIAFDQFDRRKSFQPGRPRFRTLHGVFRRASSRSTMEPLKPAAPVTRIIGILFLKWLPNSRAFQLPAGRPLEPPPRKNGVPRVIRYLGKRAAELVAAQHRVGIVRSEDPEVRVPMTDAKLRHPIGSLTRWQGSTRDLNGPSGEWRTGRPTDKSCHPVDRPSSA